MNLTKKADTHKDLKKEAEQSPRVFDLTGRRGGYPVARGAACGCSDPQGKPTCGRTGRERALGSPPEAQTENKSEHVDCVISSNGYSS